MMKKLTVLLLSLLLCLGTLLPAAAEEPVPTAEPAAEAPAIALPISFEAYKAAYEAVIAANSPEVTVTWREVEEDGRSIRMALINDSFVSVMVLLEEEMVTELAVVLKADLSQETLLSFLSMSGYCGAALLVSEEVSAAEATMTFMDELYIFFTSMTEGKTLESLCGLPGGMSISPADNSTWQYYFALKLDAE